MANHEVTPHEAAQMQAAGATIVDVRRPEELAEARLDHTLWIELDELSARAGEIDRSAPVVFLCASGSRSAMATDAFVAAGYDAHNLAGGIKAWEKEGFPVIRGAAP